MKLRKWKVSGLWFLVLGRKKNGKEFNVSGDCGNVSLLGIGRLFCRGGFWIFFYWGEEIVFVLVRIVFSC